MYVASKKQKAKMFCKKEWEKTLTWERSVIPQQHNSYYRGVYVIVFADFLSDDLALSNVFRSTFVFYRLSFTSR